MTLYGHYYSLNLRNVSKCMHLSKKLNYLSHRAVSLRQHGFLVLRYIQHVGYYMALK